MSKRKTTDHFKLPEITEKPESEKKTLPFNGSAITEKSLTFSFSCFDRTHDLFCLGDRTADGVVCGNWFIELLDCFKSVSNKSFDDLTKSTHDLHPVNWSSANTKPPDNSEQCEFWQFRINKSKGRVIGILIDRVFYIVWLDPHHNLTDSEGYGKALYYKPAKSLYELQNEKIAALQQKIKYLEDEYNTAEELLYGK